MQLNKKKINKDIKNFSALIGAKIKILGNERPSPGSHINLFKEYYRELNYLYAAHEGFLSGWRKSY